MSTNTQAKLDNSISVQAIEEVIKQNYEYIKTEQYGDTSYYIYLKNNERQRMLHVYIGLNYGTETEISKWLSLGCDNEAIEIMKTILAYFGGWLTENDCDRHYYWVEKTKEISQIKQSEVNWKSYINSQLNSIFTYDEIQKIIANRELLKTVLPYFEKLDSKS